ncbi:MafI family immunity protein [Streptomyces sp. NPDC006475]|uniref:MafI family immunity protein n=1 Tax=Streptomyces sp. NPDC006475 TaxID=3155719 RepID=UPI0033B435D2
MGQTPSLCSGPPPSPLWRCRSPPSLRGVVNTPDRTRLVTGVPDFDGLPCGRVAVTPTIRHARATRIEPGCRLSLRTRPSPGAVITNVRHMLLRGEEALTFDTMCSWIYEDDLPITHRYLDRLVAVTDEMGTPCSVQPLDSLLVH